MPWVPETFLARFPVSVKSANTENSRYPREKPLVPRVVVALINSNVRFRGRHHDQLLGANKL